MYEAATHILAGWLLDGSGAAPKKDVLLTITGGRMAAVEDWNRCGPAPEPLTDLSRCTLIPPLVDCHVHLALSGTTAPAERQRQRTAGYESLRPLIGQNIRTALLHGVLAVRDGGDALGHALRYIRENEKQDENRLLVKSSGPAWHQHGRYGGMLGRHPEPGDTLAQAFARTSQPIDQVKVINSGPNSLQIFGRETLPQFDPASLRELVLLAEERGLKVMVHANGTVPVRIALEAGCHSIEHGYFMGRENLARMARQGTVWVPTLSPMNVLADHPDLSGGEAAAAIARRTLQHQMAQVTLARELGVTVALGTDAGSMGVHHGDAVGEEFRLLLAAGCSLAEVVRCATWNGALLLGVDDRIGLIAPDRPAHFLVLEGPPADLPRTLSCLREIYLHGRPLSAGP